MARVPETLVGDDKRVRHELAPENIRAGVLCSKNRGGYCIDNANRMMNKIEQIK